jgi:hypothetical protein
MSTNQFPNQLSEDMFNNNVHFNTILHVQHWLRTYQKDLKNFWEIWTLKMLKI